MIPGFTLAYGHDWLALYCEACIASFEEPKVTEVLTDTAELAPLVEAARAHVEAEHGAGADRGRETSRALTEVRTVLSRAETARAYLEGTRCRDLDQGAMVTALDEVVRLLARWRRTGRPRRGA